MTSFFKNVARETLTGDYMPESEPSVEEQQQGSAAANSTEEQDQGYPTLPSDESESDQEMLEGQQGNPLEAVMQQLQQMKLELTEVKKQQKDNQKKEEQVSYAQTWETCANPETHDPIARVVNKLERVKVKDGALEYLQYLRDKRDSGARDESLFANLSKAEGAYYRTMREFNKDAPHYDGNPKTVFQWCEKLETHLTTFRWEQIPNDEIKKMLLGCIQGSARQEIVLLQPDGLAFENYEIAEFFQELLKKFAQEKDEEGRKLEYLARKQTRNEDARKYYTDKLRLWVQAYAPARRSLVEFKTAMLMGLYNAELRKTCLIFMPREIKNESEIRAVLDYQLTNLRTYNQDPRAPSQDMAGLRSTYGYEKSTADRTDEMLKTGQVPMDVNAMPGLMSDESEDENGSVNAMQSGDSCYFCKRTGHMKRDCKKYIEWKKNNPNRKTGNNPRKPISCYNCGKEGHISRECKSERKNSGRRENGNSGNKQMTEMVQAAVQEVLKKLAPDTVFP